MRILYLMSIFDANIYALVSVISIMYLMGDAKRVLAGSVCWAAVAAASLLSTVTWGVVRVTET